MAEEKLIFPIGFDLEEGVAKVEKDWGKMQKRLQDTFKSQTIQVDADISKAVLDKLYAKFEGLIKTMESKAPQIKLKMPDTVDFEQEINRLKVQLKSINLGELTDAESKDLYLYIRQLEALAKALKEVNKQEQLRQANNPANKALQEARAQEKLTRAKANDALAEQRRAKIATETARQNEINNRSAQRGAVIAEQKRAATARAEQAELRLTQAKERSAKATQEQNTAYAQQSTYLQRLFQRMVAYASVAQAMSFLRNIKDVTAEFELQRVALGALIQDAQKADMIFEQIKVQAVKSPYEVKDLVTYTKQLAAYGVKADDLMGTMNDLADISAGLGADMNRIILAYGQIQAAGVLKGTELKQLTELGLPMVELLADYYSTLRNEVVTTSEVFDMISNKEIPFEAVQSILQDLTSEGGRFFDMQEKQAETLQGQWSNMKDTLSIMFDEIGRSEEVRALLNGMIDSVKWLAENWRLVWKGVKSVVLAYGSLKVATSLTKALAVTMDVLRYSETRAQIATNKYNVARIAANRTLLTQGRVASLTARQMQLVAFLEMRAATATNVLTRAFAKLGAVLMANPVTAIMALVGGIASFVIATKGAEAEIETFEDQQRKFAEGTMENIGIQVQSFKRLAQEVVHYADGSDKQQSALRKLKDSFGDLLPEYQLTVEYLRKVSDEANGSADAFDRMANSVRAAATVRLRDKLLEQREEELDERLSDVYDQLTGGGFTIPVSTFANMQKQIEDGIYWEDVYLAWRKGMEEASGALTYGDYWRHRLSTEGIRFLSGIDGNGLAEGDEVWFTWKELLDAYNKGLIKWEDYERLLQQIIGAEGVKNINTLYDYLNFLGTYQEGVEDIIDDYDTLAGEFDKISEIVDKARNDMEKAPLIGGKTYQQSYINIEESRKQVEREAYYALLEQFKSENEDLYNQMEEIAYKSFDKFLEDYKGGKWKDIELPANIVYGIEELRKTFGYMDDEWRNFMARQVSFVNNNPVVAFNTQQINSFGTLYDAIDQVGKSYKETTDKLEVFRNLRARTLDASALAYYDQEIARLEALGGQYYDFLTRYGWEDEEKKRKREQALRDAQSALSNELSMVEKIYKEYEGLRKYMSDTEARANIEKMFGNVSFDTLGIALSPEEMREQLQKALQRAKKLGDKKLVADIEYKLGKLDVDAAKREIEGKLKKLSDDISHTKTAKEFFDKMLGLTGDKQLSATLTMNVYGEGAEDLGQKLAEQTIAQLEAAFQGVDISSAIDKTTNKVDYTKLMSFIENLPEEARKNAESLVDAGMKANADWLDDLQKTYQKAFTFEERRTQVMAREAQAREDIEKSALLPDDEKSKYIEASRKKEAEDIATINLEEFKDTDDYIKMFSDIEKLSIPTIQRLIDKLREFIDTNKELSATDLKNLTEQIDKLEEGLVKKDAWTGLTSGIKDWVKARKAMSGLTKGTKEYTDALDDANKANVQIQNALDALQNEFSQAQQLVDNFGETLGVAEDSAFGQFLNGMSTAIGGVVKALAFASLAVKLFDGTIKSFLATNPLGWILMIASAIMGVFQAIANAKVNKANEVIESLEDRLDSLSYAYDRLQKAQEKAFGTEYIRIYEQQLENLEAQVEAYEKQLAAERSKGKKADEDKIKEYENSVRDTKDAIADMYGTLSEQFLGSDLSSAARDFAQAWIDAYKEFANTSDAMKEKFQDMIQNMIVESLLARVMEQALKPVFTMIDNMGEGDFYSTSFWKEVMGAMDTATENGVVGAQNVMTMLEQMGVNLRGLGGDMTGISRDIASASEESILGLAAGINTQNFYISQVPPKLDVIIGLLRGDGTMPQGSTITLQDVMIAQNQFLSHLPTIAQHTAETVAECKQIVAETRRTADALERVIKPRGTQSTYTINATLN